MILIFDMDDTLYPEEQFALSGFRAVDEYLARVWRLTGFFDAATRLLGEGETRHVFDRFLVDAIGEAPVGLVLELVEIYRSHTPQLEMFPDAVWAIRHYHSRSRLGLLSDGYLETQRNKARALKIDNIFDLLVFTDEYGRDKWKPSLYGYRRCMEHFGDVPSTYCYISDNPLKDFVAPNLLGWRTIRIQRESGFYRDVSVPLGAEAQATITSLTELPGILG